MTMSQADLFYRCMALIALLNQEQQWGLTDLQRGQYAQVLVTLVEASDSDADICFVAKHYHQEHRRISILSTPAHPEHQQTWDELRSELLAVIYKARLYWLRDQAVTLEDLVQIAYLAVVQSLPSFRFRSRFFTWLTPVVARNLQHVVRAANAQKRTAEVESLEAQAEEVEQAALETTEAQVSYWLLVDQIKQMLRSHRDKRLAAIFELRFCKDMSTREIAQMFNLSEVRVRALLEVIKKLIEDDPSLMQWNRDG
jgi:RNA polymerase sigma factor (sigma-70 family)